jgi:hypothetical protein
MPAMTRLKRLDPEEREWAYGLREEFSCEEALQKIEARFGIRLKHISAFSAFCRWQIRQRVWDHANAMVAQDQGVDPFPGMTMDQVRDLQIKRAIAIADAMSDPKLGLQAVKASQDEVSLNLDSVRVQTQTCALFLQWFADKRAQEIATSTVSNADKIAALRQVYFADVDALEKSGKVKLPA